MPVYDLKLYETLSCCPDGDHTYESGPFFHVLILLISFVGFFLTCLDYDLKIVIKKKMTAILPTKPCVHTSVVCGHLNSWTNGLTLMDNFVELWTYFL